MVDDPRDMAIVRAMTTLGKDLGLRVVAEGVEALAQATLLSDLRCDRAQGFLWSAAVPLEEFLILSRSTFASPDLAHRVTGRSRPGQRRPKPMDSPRSR
jgi:diguanylate cyclase